MSVLDALATQEVVTPPDPLAAPASEIPEDIATLSDEELHRRRDEYLTKTRSGPALSPEDLRTFVAITSTLRTRASTSKPPTREAKKVKLTSLDQL